MTLDRLWSCLAVLLPVLAALVAPLPSVDLAYHLRAGAEILEMGAIPRFDSFTFTAAGLPWQDQQWAAQIALTLTFRIGDWVALSILRALVVGVAFVLVYVACRWRGADVRGASWLTLAAFVISAPALALRPQLFGIGLLALVLALIAARRRWPLALWLVPAVTTIWANVHGSFVLAPIVLALASLEDFESDRRTAGRTAIVAAVSVAAALINPFGLDVYGYAFGITTNPSVTARISEWQPTTLRTPTGVLFLASVLVVAIVLIRSRRAVKWSTLAWLLPFVLLGLVAERGVAWWPLVAAVALAPLVASTRRPEKRAKARLNQVVTAVVIAAVIAALPVWRTREPNTGAPVGAVTFAPAGLTAALRSTARRTDRLLNPQVLGSWIEFAVPVVPVAIDSRIELFPAAVWDDYSVAMDGGDGWESILERWGVTLAIASADSAGLSRRLQGLGWRVLYEDADGQLLSSGERR